MKNYLFTNISKVFTYSLPQGKIHQGVVIFQKPHKYIYG